MAIIQFYKSQPTDYVMLFKSGRLKKKGEGLSFFYYAPTSSIVVVPMGNQDQPFIFREHTRDFQELTVQGSLTYRITDPVAIAKAMNFSLNEQATAYRSDDPEKLANRIINRLQVLVRSYTQSLPLGEALEMKPATFSTIQKHLAESEYLKTLGINVLELSITAIKPNPETAGALQTRERERLLQEADDAIYLRRNASVEAERKIRENELQTEEAVEQKKRRIQEVKLEAVQQEQVKRQEMHNQQMLADIELAIKRKELVVQNQENERIEADALSYKFAKQLEPVKQLEPELVKALANMGMQPAQLMAKAFTDFANNADKIGNLNINRDAVEGIINGEVA
ncbi:SPFH domain-containing protein [Pleionea mediterranea]|uniref:Regulator of protease activity HflC (Stomatin/prohibitin superfamily) n=1 Tax=Pleionea mediterranea TaxID=523701 RepID=A0A316FQD9_9GAMM|nr:SPFH domain-containing protein [Pleionea mediterranea]PWK49870.1 regulator of protease activity HflC (stomatin/prohibitin superfamily) [Pleionea mediterranea]